jgi:hypothetical protein
MGRTAGLTTGRQDGTAMRVRLWHPAAAAPLRVVLAAGLVAAAAQQSAPAPVHVRDPQRGVTLWGQTAAAYGQPAAQAALDDIRAVGASWVTLVPSWSQPTVTSSAIARRPGVTADDAALVAAVQAAHARGLQVALKPHVDVADGSWRGDIAPADPDAWFASYRALVAHYADLGSRWHVEQLVVGTELAGTSRDTARWSSVIALARSRFSGQLTYAALPFEWEQVRFWNRLDSIGVNAWWPLSTTATSDVAALRASLAPLADALGRASARWHRPVLLTEAGFTSQRGTATAPATWTLSRTPAPQEQAAGYQAVLDVFAGRPWWAGVSWWAWRADNQPEPLGFSPQGAPAADVLRTEWATSGITSQAVRQP